MALNQLNLRVSKEDFEARIMKVEADMSRLMDVIDRYNNAKANMDQFIEEGDSNYEAMVARIDENIRAAKKAHAALSETKVTLQETVTQMEGMSQKVQSTLQEASEAASSAIQAAIKIDSIL